MNDFGSDDDANEPLTANEYKSGHDKIKQVQDEIDVAISVAKDNLNKAVDRGDRLEDIEDKSNALQQEAGLFKKNARKTHVHFCLRQWRMICVLICILGVLGLSLGLWSFNSGNGDIDNAPTTNIDSNPDGTGANLNGN